jgi:hypothetical protein
MKKGLALDRVRLLIIVTISVGIGFQILSSINRDIEENIKPDSVYPEVDYPYCSTFDTNQVVGRKDFERLLFYRVSGDCQVAEQKARLGFVLENKTLNSILRNLGLEDSDGDVYAYFRDNCGSARSLNLNGVKLGTENNKILYQKDEKIEISGRRGSVTIC